MSEFILVSESKIGCHHTMETDERVHHFAMVFPPSIDMENGSFVDLSKNRIFSKITNLAIRLEKEGNLKGILVGYDMDEAGEMMSDALRENLVRQGIPEKLIYRTPLTERGYVFIRDFVDTSTYRRYLAFQQELMSAHRKSGLSQPVGLEKTLALKYLTKHAGGNFSLKSEQTNLDEISTATVVTRHIEAGGTNE